jgi:hypothetical protein
MNKFFVTIIPVMLLQATLVGCGPSRQQPNSDWLPVKEAQLTSDQAAQRDKALLARDAMFKSLKGRLVEVVGTEGPTAAIEVCSIEAPQIADQVSQEHGLAIGRTSFRLRNPDNSPPEWAARLVEDRVAEPEYLTNDGRFAALLPIRLQPECLMCHGQEEEILPAVADALAEHYPQDKATGFREGDLRGWFWVEVPAVD